MSRRVLLRQALAAGALGFAPLSAAKAQAQVYPQRPIKVVVPFPAGGPTDVAARLISQALSTELKQSVVVENVAGAGGRIGAKAVANAAPDGYTLLLGGTNVNALTGALYKDVGFDPIGSFAPVAVVCVDSLAMAMSNSVPVSDFQQFVTYAKANPGKLRFGAPPGIYTHVAAEFVKFKTGTDLAFVPYRGGANAITDLLGGHIQIVFNTKATLLDLIKEGHVKALAVSSQGRWPELPETPTLQEVGAVGFPTEILFGLLAPKDVPSEIVARLNAAVTAALKSPEVQASLAKLGMDVKFGSPQDFATALNAQASMWKQLVAETGIKVE